MNMWAHIAVYAFKFSNQETCGEVNTFIFVWRSK